MAATKRVQVLMEPDEFERMQGIARQRKTSVGALFREAVRIKYLDDSAKERALETIFSMNLDVGSPEELREEILSARDYVVP